VVAAAVYRGARGIRPPMHTLSKQFGAKLQKGAVSAGEGPALQIIQKFGARLIGDLQSCISGRPTKWWPPRENWTIAVEGAEGKVEWD